MTFSLPRPLLATLLLALPLGSDAGCYQNQETGAFCSGHGWCDRMACNCWDGYEGPACEYKICPSGKAWSDEAQGVDNAHNLAVCSNRGHCDRITGLCTCLPEFQGKACDRMACPGFPTCNGHGRCISQKRMIEQQYEMKYDYWDGDMIYGCVCDDHWEGYDCSLRSCPTGDDPMTTLNQVNEVQYFTCDMMGDIRRRTHFYLGFRNSWTTKINWDDSATQVQLKLMNTHSLDDVLVEFRNGFNATTVCADGVSGVNALQRQIVRVEFLRQFGDLPPLQVLTDEYTGPQIDVACVTDNPWFPCLQDRFSKTTETGLEVSVDIASKGTKEEASCSNRGACDQTSGICGCYYPFYSSDGNGPRNPPLMEPNTRKPGPGSRGECGYKDANGQVYTCPGEVACMGHGVCLYSPTFACECSTGWTGAACDLRTCPFGKAWFGAPEADNNAHKMMECSNRGFCERDSGQCWCQSFLQGHACDEMKCPVSMEQEEWGLCSGHGDCLYMWELALKAEDNGDATDFTYGATPSDEARWDFDQIRGCKCDAGFTGIDCASRECPRTDDENTPGDSEIQEIVCGAFDAGAGQNGHPQDQFGGAYGCFGREKQRKMTVSLGITPYTDGYTKTTGVVVASNAHAGKTAEQTALAECTNFPVCAGVVQSIAPETARNADGSWNYQWELMRSDPANQIETAQNHWLYERVECTYKLSFRQAQTVSFHTRSTRAEVEAALNALPTVRTGSLVVTSNDSSGQGWLCPKANNEGAKNTFRIEFKENFGNLPLVKFIGPPFGWLGQRYTSGDPTQIVASTTATAVAGPDVTPVTVKEHRAGTKENAICGDHGLCDYTLGECRCYTGYSSSDGNGGKGSIGDCGYRVPHLNAAGGGDDG